MGSEEDEMGKGECRELVGTLSLYIPHDGETDQGY